MKKIEWKNPNKMVIDTGLKSFDRQCRCVSYGNVISNTQVSLYVRSARVTECNGRQYPEGALMKYDLGKFVGMPPYLRHRVETLLAGDRPHVIVYKFFYWNSRSEATVVGWVVTEGHELNYRHLLTAGACTGKAQAALEEIRKYVTNEI